MRARLIFIIHLLITVQAFSIHTFIFLLLAVLYSDSPIDKEIFIF